MTENSVAGIKFVTVAAGAFSLAAIVLGCIMTSVIVSEINSIWGELDGEIAEFKVSFAKIT